MDSTLDLKLKDFKKAFESLNNIVKTGFETDDILRDAAIQRFEYTYELFWKTYKLYLEETFGTLANSPKEVFRALLKHNILTADETHLALNMVSDRNSSTHAYNETFAVTLALKIPDYIKLFEHLSKQK